MAKRKRKGKLPAGVVAVIIVLAVAFYVYDTINTNKNKAVEIEGSCQFHFIDVGQGDATMIISEKGTVVIDAGPGDHADTTLEYIKRYTNTIDYLILTHPHEDHIGGADEILEAVKVENVIISDAYSDTLVFSTMLDAIDASGCNVIEAISGDSYTAGDIEFTILAPISEFTDMNDYSIVTLVEYGETGVMVTGDVENHSEGLIVEKYRSSELSADILQMGHHGSSTSNSARFMDAVDPDYAVISCGAGNSYGHPHRETIEKLENRGIEYLRTDKIGHIVFESDGEQVALLEEDQ